MKTTKILKAIIAIAVIGLTISCSTVGKKADLPAPQNFTANEITPRGIIAKWDAVEGATHYRVMLTIDYAEIVELNTSDTTLTINSSNLPQNILPSTTYTIRVNSFIGKFVGDSSPGITITTSIETAAEKVERERQAAEGRKVEDAITAAITNSQAFQSLIGTWTKDVANNMVKAGDTVTFPNYASSNIVVSRNNLRGRVQSISENQITIGNTKYNVCFKFKVSGNTLTVSNATIVILGFRKDGSALNGTYTKVF